MTPKHFGPCFFAAPGSSLLPQRMISISNMAATFGATHGLKVPELSQSDRELRFVYEKRYKWGSGLYITLLYIIFVVSSYTVIHIYIYIFIYIYIYVCVCVCKLNHIYIYISYEMANVT